MSREVEYHLGKQNVTAGETKSTEKRKPSTSHQGVPNQS